MLNYQRRMNPYQRAYNNLQLAARYSVPAAVSTIGQRYWPKSSNLISGRKGLKKAKGKPRGVYKRKAPAYKQVSGLKKQVQQLSKIAKADQGTLIYRTRKTSEQIALMSEQSCVHYPINNVTSIELALAQLRYYDPSAPATLLTADGASGTYSKDFLFKPVYGKIQIRNNYKVPCRVTVYVVEVKNDTGIDPVTAWTNGLADVGGPSSVNPMTYLTDSHQFLDLWKIASTKSYEIPPGNEISCSHSSKSFSYDPSIYDSHNLLYQRAQGAFSFVVKLQGVLCHEPVTDNQGFSKSGIDVAYYSITTISYNAGADIKTIILSDTIGLVTTNAVVSNPSVVTNQSYNLT